jgi:AbrB family looped-hinge helix DNA binding protein
MSKEILQMETHVTTKGQIIIPETLRRKYGIKEGTRILVFDNGDSIVLKPMTEEYLKKLQGSLKGKGALKELIDERRKDKFR